MARRATAEREARTHALVFDDPERALEAAKLLRKDGFEVGDVYTPFPVPGMSEALGMRPSRLGFAALVGGIMGLSAGLALQLYTHAYSWPLIIGGKDNIAAPVLVPVAFELTILFAAFGTVIGLLYRSRLFPGRRPRGPVLWEKRVTDDLFVVVVLEGDGGFAPERFAELCAELGPKRVVVGGRMET